MTFEDLMDNLGHSIGLDEFKPNEDGVCELISEEVTVTLQHCPEVKTVLCTAVLGEASAGEAAAVLKMMLEKNFLYVGTRGSTVAIDPKTSLIYLTRYDGLDEIDASEFTDRVTAFLGTAIELQKEIENARQAALQGASGEGAPMAFGNNSVFMG